MAISRWPTTHAKADPTPCGSRPAEFRALGHHHLESHGLLRDRLTITGSSFECLQFLDTPATLKTGPAHGLPSSRCAQSHRDQDQGVPPHVRVQLSGNSSASPKSVFGDNSSPIVYNRRVTTIQFARPPRKWAYHHRFHPFHSSLSSSSAHCRCCRSGDQYRLVAGLAGPSAGLSQ